MRVTRYGQSAMLIEDAGTRLLIDPGSFCSDHVFTMGGLDAVLFTHEHADHCDPVRVPGLLAESPATPVYAPGAVLELLGLAGTESEASTRSNPVSHGNSFTVGTLSVEAVGALHQVILPGMARCVNSGYVVTSAAGTRLFYPGDSYETVPANIDVLAVPLLGPWSSLRETVDFVTAVAPARIFAVHDALLNASGRALFWRLLLAGLGPHTSTCDIDAATGRGSEIGT